MATSPINLSDEQLQQIIEGVKSADPNKPEGQNGTPAAVQASPISVTVDGQVYSFKDQNELSAGVQQLIGGFRQQLSLAHIDAASDPGAQVTGAETVKAFSDENYWKIAKEQGVRSAAEYLDNYRFFGGTEENPSQKIKEALENVKQTKTVMAAYNFKSKNADFPGTQEAIAVLDQTRERLKLPFTEEGLTAAWGTLKSMIADQRARQAQQQYQTAMLQQGQNPYGQPPPNPYGPPASPYGQPTPQNFNPAAFNPALANHPQFNPGAAPPNMPMGYGFEPPPSMSRSATEPPPNIASIAENMTEEQLLEAINRASTGQTPGANPYGPPQGYPPPNPYGYNPYGQR